jgi:hypothetical protein
MAKKATDGAGMRRHVTPFAVHRGKRTAKRALCRAPRPKTHSKEWHIAVRPYKRTVKALFLLLVLVTLSCVLQKTHDKVAIAIFLFSTFKNTQKSLE